MLHVIKEPSIDLGTLENNRLRNTLMRLRDLGKTLIELAAEESSDAIKVSTGLPTYVVCRANARTGELRAQELSSFDVECRGPA